MDDQPVSETLQRVTHLRDCGAHEVTDGRGVFGSGRHRAPCGGQSALLEAVDALLEESLLLDAEELPAAEPADEPPESVL